MFGVCYRPLNVRCTAQEHPTDFKITYLFLLFPLPLCPLRPLRLIKKISYGESLIASEIKKNQKMGNRDTKVIRRVISPLFTTNQAIENGKRFYIVVHRAERFRQDH